MTLKHNYSTHPLSALFSFIRHTRHPATTVDLHRTEPKRDEYGLRERLSAPLDAHIFVISLLKAADRRAHTQERMEALGRNFTLVNAMEASLQDEVSFCVKAQQKLVQQHTPTSCAPGSEHTACQHRNHQRR